MGKISGHVSEYIGRYVVIASIVLVPLAGIVGDVAAELGPDTRLGHTLLSVASALGTAAAIVVWLRNRGLFESAPLIGQAQGEAIAAAATAPPPSVIVHAGRSPTFEVAASELSDLEDAEADAAPADVSDEEEFAAPPPDDDTTTPVPPSELSDAEADDPPRP